MLRPFHRPDRQASSLAAAMLVMVQAVTGVAFVLVLVAEDPDKAFLLIAGGVFLLAVVGAWLYARPASLLADTMSWVLSRKARPDRIDYQMSRRPVSFRRFGTNTPPSVDQIRDLKSGTTNNWVPSRTTPRRESV
jgi:hypothetical protein